MRGMSRKHFTPKKLGSAESAASARMHAQRDALEVIPSPYVNYIEVIRNIKCITLANTNFRRISIICRTPVQNYKPGHHHLTHPHTRAKVEADAPPSSKIYHTIQQRVGAVTQK